MEPLPCPHLIEVVHGPARCRLAEFSLLSLTGEIGRLREALAKEAEFLEERALDYRMRARALRELLDEDGKGS